MATRIEPCERKQGRMVSALRYCLRPVHCVPCFDSNGITKHVTESRGTPRRTVSTKARLKRSGAVSYNVRAYDISENGCRLEFVERPRPNETVWVKFDGLEPIRSTVRWTEDFTVGIEFERPIDSRVLELLLDRMR